MPSVRVGSCVIGRRRERKRKGGRLLRAIAVERKGGKLRKEGRQWER
jgi:hypothetical protein